MSGGPTFVEFYRELDISPVVQDISDLARHFRRRESLYRFLGIPAGAVRGASVLEFGPGSGHNALYTAHLGPRRYVLVDANPRAIAESGELFARHGVTVPIELVDSMIESYASTERFDLVLAEGLLAFQHAPVELARSIASHVAPGGLLVVTCSDAVSQIADNGRRIAARRLVSPDLPAPERVAALRPHLAPHIATLEGMSRRLDDWIYDSILHPFHGRELFSIADAIGALDGDFDVYGGSPRFVTDWRWYKQVAGPDRAFNARAVTAYRENVVNLLDYRVVIPPQSAAFGDELIAACEPFYATMQRLEASGDERIMEAFPSLLARIAALVRPLSPLTAASLDALRDFLAARAVEPERLEAFIPCFGRGMQYLSFIRGGEDA